MKNICSNFFSQAMVNSKFQRLKHFHMYLWILAHGFHETTPTRLEFATNEPSTSSGLSHSHTVPTSTLHFLPTTSFPWAAMVTQLPPGGRGSGWLQYNDIVPNMPFSLCSILMANLVVGRVSSHSVYHHFFSTHLPPSLPLSPPISDRSC